MMALTYDAATNNITCPRGDTGVIPYTITGLALSADDVLIFAVADYRGINLMTIAAPITDGAASVTLTNADTRVLPAGRHYYNVRIVTDPEYDGDGNVICEDATDNVITLYNKPPRFLVTEVCADV